MRFVKVSQPKRVRRKQSSIRTINIRVVIIRRFVRVPFPNPNPNHSIAYSLHCTPTEISAIILLLAAPTTTQNSPSRGHTDHEAREDSSEPAPERNPTTAPMSATPSSPAPAATMRPARTAAAFINDARAGRDFRRTRQRHGSLEECGLG